MMQGPSILLRSDDEDDVLEIGANDNSRPFRIPDNGMQQMPQMPRPFNNSSAMSNQQGFGGVDPLINMRKVSSDVISRSSGQDSRDGTDYTESEADDTESYVSDNAPVQPRMNTNTNMNRNGGAYADPTAARMVSERGRMEAEMNEKREILYQLDVWKAKDIGFLVNLVFNPIWKKCVPNIIVFCVKKK